MPRVVHFEIHAPDAQKAIDFYRDVFDWEFNQFEGGEWEYHLATTGKDQPGIDGGLMPSRDASRALSIRSRLKMLMPMPRRWPSMAGRLLCRSFRSPAWGTWHIAPIRAASSSASCTAIQVPGRPDVFDHTQPARDARLFAQGDCPCRSCIPLHPSRSPVGLPHHTHRAAHRPRILRCQPLRRP